MPEDAGTPPRKSKLIPRGRRLNIPGGRRDTAVVFALLLAALGSVWLVLALGRPDGPGREGEPRKRPASVVPSRIPYAELVSGKARGLPDGRVEILYDFEQEPGEGGARRNEAELYRQLDDWNWSIGGGGEESGIVRGEGRFLGQARTRLAFTGPVEAAAELELRGGVAAIQLATDRAGVGYECAVYATGAVRLRVRRLPSLSPGRARLPEGRGGKGRRTAGRKVEVEDLAEPARMVDPPAKRRIALLFAKSDRTLRVEIDGREVMSVPLPSPDAFPEGNIALRSRGGPALWDNVRMTGRLSPATLENRMHVAVGLTPRDRFEPDDRWSGARELLADGSEQERTFMPEGDIDWASVAVPRGEGGPGRLVRTETRDLRLGIVTELAAFASDGRTLLEVRQLPAEEPGAAVILIDARAVSSGLFYVRISEPEGRAGSYRLRAVTEAPPPREHERRRRGPQP